jgi:hypothetical protein
MLVCVKFHVGMREVRMLLSWFAVKEISEEEGAFLLMPSSTMLWDAAFVQKLLTSTWNR